MSDTPHKGKHSGVGFRSRSGAVFFDMGAIQKKSSAAKGNMKATVADPGLISLAPWSPWGADNNLAAQYTEDIETCGILTSVVDGKARFGIGQGIQPALVHTDPDTGERVIDKYIDDDEIMDWLDENNAYGNAYAWMRDLVGYNWGVCRYMLDAGGNRIARIKRDDLTECRFEKEDKSTGIINRLWYSAQWDKVRSPNDQRVWNLPLLGDYDQMEQIDKLAAAGKREFAYAIRQPMWGKHYYPVPLWMAVYKWVKIAQAVPEMKASLFEMSMRPLYKVIIMEDYWENRYGAEWDDWDEDKQEEKRNEFYDEIDEWLVGKENQGKSLYVNGRLVGDDGKVITDIDIIPIDNPVKPGELLPDSAAANSEIAIAMLWNNALTGGNQKHGQYSGNEGGSNVREASLLQTIIHEVERKAVARFMRPVKRRNGWDARYQKDGKRLEFLVQATVMTTLDAGTNSEPVVTGGAQKKKPTKPADNADKND